MTFTHTPAHTTEHPDHYTNDVTGASYEVVPDTDAQDPRTFIEDEHAAVYTYHGPRGNQDATPNNIAAKAFAFFLDNGSFDNRALEMTRRYLAAFHPEKKIAVAIQTVRGYSQGDWRDVFAAISDGYGTPESHINEFRMWAFGDVWMVIPSVGDACSSIYADDAEEALKYYLADQPKGPLSYTLLMNETDLDQVTVTTSDGESLRIHREDADPEHRHLSYRLAATYFGNQPSSSA